MKTPLETTLADYRLVREAGFGAMSIVYEAVDRRDGQTVALKVLSSVPPSRQGEQQRSLIARLQREARLVARLNHPNIVHIREVGEWEDCHYLAMEYLHGQTLRERLDTGPLPLPEAVQIVSQVGAALDAVHAQGIIHRDIKPSNVMLLPDGRAKVMDFGVARRSDDTAITQTGMIVGSPAYMSPEQIRGDDGAPASDLWALGVLLYEMLAGRSPFPGPNISAVLYSVTHDTPPPIPGITSRLQKVVRKALDKTPQRRYKTARELTEALRAASAPLADGHDWVLPGFVAAIGPHWQRGLLAAAGLTAVIGGALLLGHRPPVARTASPALVTAITPALRSLPGVLRTEQTPQPAAPTIRIRETPLPSGAASHRTSIRRHHAPPPHAIAARPARREAQKPVKLIAFHSQPISHPRQTRHAHRQLRHQHWKVFFPSKDMDYEHDLPFHPVYDPQGPT